MSDDLVKRLRASAVEWDDLGFHEDARREREVADRIELLERHVEYRDFFLLENDLWGKFAESVKSLLGGKEDA